MDVHICTALFFFLCFFMTSASYLGYPRINFAGHFRADTDTRNNIRCNYRLDHDIDDDFNADWGFNGTNEFQWFENIVTSVSYLDGTESTDDTVVGKHIVGNLKRPFSKLTDLDTDSQDRSTIYGMKFGISYNKSFPAEDMRFFGDWTRSVIAQDMWPRVKCYSDTNHGDQLYQDSFPFGASGTTTIDNIDWNSDFGDSTVLEQLKTASQETNGKLSVRVALFFYTRNLPSYIAKNATLGYVVGSIGASRNTETLNVGGQRVMNPTGNIPLGTTFTNQVDDLCYNQDLADYPPWMSKAPFEIDSSRNKINVDLSNSLPTNFYNSIRDIGDLQLGIFIEKSNCVQLIGTEYIPYLTENWLETDSGIYTVFVTISEIIQLANSKLVVVQVVTSGGSSSICGAATFSGASADSHSVEIILEESPYFIRPSDYYVSRLSANGKTTQTFYVTYYGEPASDINVEVALQNSDVIPSDGVVPDLTRKSTNSDGYVSFEFTNSGNIPYPRQYPFPPCEDDITSDTLPIEGQVYYYKYAVCPSSGSCNPYDTSYSLTFLAFSNVEYNTPPYNWVDHVQPILAQYAQLVPIMGKILDMGSYVEITKPHNLELMTLSLSLGMDDPGHMPTTRDLSPTKRDMILDWLKDPRYNAAGNTPPSVDIKQCTAPESQGLKPRSYYSPDRCETTLAFTEHPKVKEPYFGDISNISIDSVRAKVKKVIKGRPLIGLRQVIADIRNKVHKANEPTPQEICDVDTLKTQLQTAISLEFSTLPTYLTGLYSIVDGCNQEIYNLIRSVVIQEMLHMTQAANTLISLGGSPQIDSTDCVHQYPTGLPGGVLPGLVVTLKKLSLEHVHDVFMAIEVPQETQVVDPPIDHPNLYTIGAFYEEISDCIEFLRDQDVFDPLTAPLQVRWPWNPDSAIGNVVTVTDTDSALLGIEMVIAQGEGEGLIDPTDLDNDTIAHFFKFEGIVCQNHLKQVDDTTYEYSGLPIPFNSEGVWNMRNNPSASDINTGTNCYTEARAFHEAFRNLLRSLQEVFNGSPQKINVAVEIMESMQVHGKKTMWTKFKPESIEMCGPVWDYEWPEITRTP